MFTLIILEGNCNGEGRAFAQWVEATQPNVTVDFRANCEGVGGGLFDDDGNEIDNRLWEEFCRS